MVCVLWWLQSQQQLSRLQAAADAHANNVADRDAFVTATAAKLGIQLPGAAAVAAASSLTAASGQAVQLPNAALETFLSELQSRKVQLQGQLAAQRQQHRWDAFVDGKLLHSAHSLD